MTISICLDETTERNLKEYLRTKNSSMSEFVRSAINEKLARYQTSVNNPYEMGKNLFGAHGSAKDDLSSKWKSQLKEKLNAKHSIDRNT